MLISQRGVIAGTEQTVLLHFTLTADYRRLIGPTIHSPNFSTAHIHIPSKPVGNFRRWGSWVVRGAAEGLHAVCPFYRVPKYSRFIAQKHCFSRDIARQLLCTRTSRIYGITEFARMHWEKPTHPSFSVTWPCVENRSLSSRTRCRNANLCSTLPISLLSVLTAANERGTALAQHNAFRLLTA